MIAPMGIADDVIQFVAQWSKIEPSKILSETELWRDLHIDGDEMLELFLDYQKAFDG